MAEEKPEKLVRLDDTGLMLDYLHERIKTVEAQLNGIHAAMDNLTERVESLENRVEQLRSFMGV